MRELQQGASTSTTLSPRPPLAPSYSSPAAVIAHPSVSPNNNNHNNSTSSGVHSTRELERTRSSPIATSPSTSASSHSGGSLKSRLVRVASSNSLFSKTGSAPSHATSIGTSSNTTTANNDGTPTSPSTMTQYNHRKTASLASSSGNNAGPSPSPRSRLAASVATHAQQNHHQQNGSPVPSSSSTFSRSHAYRHSEDVRQFTRSSPALDVPSSAYGKNHASSPPLSSSPSMATSRAPSPNLHALREREGEDGIPTSNRPSNGLFSNLSVSGFSLTRKRSVDGLSLASNVSSQHLPIPEDEENPQEDENGQSAPNHDEDQTAKRNSGGSVEQKSSSHTENASRPPLGERYLSSDRLPQDGQSVSSLASKSTTPGFPRHIPNASYSSTYTNPSSSSASYTSTNATNADGTLATTTSQSQRTGLISSGLSESSRRFRSAFRLNKSRAAGVATPGGNEAAASLMCHSTTTRRAMRVPLRQQQMDNEDEEENNNEEKQDAYGNAAANGNESPGQASVSINTTANDTASPKPLDSDSRIDNKGKPRPTMYLGRRTECSTPANSPTLTKTPPEVISHDYAHHANVRHPTPPTGPHISHTLPHDSGNASRSRSTSPRIEVPRYDEEHEAREREIETARERAQLVPQPMSSLQSSTSHASSSSISHKSTAGRPVKIHALGDGLTSGALRPGRAMRTNPQQEADIDEEASPEHGRSASAANSSSQARQHARTASHGRLEDLMLVQEAGNLAHARPASRQQTHAPISHNRNTSDNTLVGTAPERGRDWQVQPQMDVHHHQSLAAHRDRQPSPNEQEEVLAIDNDKENAVAGDWYRQHKSGRDEKTHDLDKNQHHHGVSSVPSADGLKSRTVLGQVRKPLQEQQVNNQHSVPGGFLPEPRQQGPLPQQHRVGKLSSSSSNGGLGYFPGDRQVVVNDYAVPTKRSGDTPPSNEKEPHHFVQPPNVQARQQQESHAQYPYQHSRAAPPPTRPPATSLPALPSLPPHPQQNHDQQVQVQAPVQKRAPGTVTVQGKTYTRMGLLGRGGSSKVFRVCDKDHLVYALKKIDLGRGADSETYQAFLNEISLLEALRGHDRIIQLVAHEVNEVKRSLIMVMEIGEIDLNALLQERIAKGLPASMNFVRYMWEQMLEAVNVIHEKGIVHTDLKPANFVLVKGALKLIDFGIAKAIPNDTTNIARDQQIGTANYMSPEALNPHNSAKNGRVMKVSCLIRRMICPFR